MRPLAFVFSKKCLRNRRLIFCGLSEVKWLSGFKALDCLPMESGFAIHSVYIRDVCSTFKIYPVFSRNIPTIYSWCSLFIFTITTFLHSHCRPFLFVIHSPYFIYSGFFFCSRSYCFAENLSGLSNLLRMTTNANIVKNVYTQYIRKSSSL